MRRRCARLCVPSCENKGDDVDDNDDDDEKDERIDAISGGFFKLAVLFKHPVWFAEGISSGGGSGRRRRDLDLRTIKLMDFIYIA